MIDALGSPQSMLVLGAGSDIAQATVRRLAGRRLTRVTLAGRDVEALETVAAELRGSGVDADVERFDARDVDAHAAWVAELFQRSGGYDVVLAAFGVLGDQSAAEADPAAANEIVATNFTGFASVGLPVALRLRDAGAGVLVLLSSVAGERVRRANFVYGASKAGADAFAQGLDSMLDGSGARVLIVRPGFVHSKMTSHLSAAPLAATPEDVAAAIEAALASGARVAYVPKVLRLLFAVLRHLPVAVFRRLPLG